MLIAQVIQIRIKAFVVTLAMLLGPIICISGYYYYYYYYYYLGIIIVGWHALHRA